MTISRESTEETPVREVSGIRGLGRYRIKYGTRGAPVEREPGEPVCYTDEWKRTNPDFAVYLPERFIGRDSDNVHFLVTVTPGGDLLGSWTRVPTRAQTMNAWWPRAAPTGVRPGAPRSRSTGLISATRSLPTQLRSSATQAASITSTARCAIRPCSMTNQQSGGGTHVRTPR